MSADPASFRDPAGRIFVERGRVFRAIAEHAVADFDVAHQNPALRRQVDQGGVIASSAANDCGIRAAKVVEHPRLPFVSYPYEWPFALLKRAALHHLDLQITLLQGGISLSDASAYNVQFHGPRPIFIDALSFRPYTEGEHWVGHRQFCEQFLNPLLLHSVLGVPHNAWFRGSLEGVPTDALARLMPFARRFSPRIAAHVMLSARLQHGADAAAKAKAAAARPLSRNAYLGLLTDLRVWISGLRLYGAKRTLWGDYAERNSYSGEERAAKQDVVARFAARARPKLMFDFGCNSGLYSETALAAGAHYAVGFDADHGALEAACARAAEKKLQFLPLYQDAANPSPGQGWDGRERQDLVSRGPAEALVALAFVHHIAIGRNVPLDRFIDWLLALAPTGVVEFVPKSDPMVARLLALRKDIFPDYAIESFRSLIARQARIVESTEITATGRTLIVYDRRK